MQEGVLEMSKKERDRLAWMAKVQAKEMTVVDAAQAMGVSYRQAKRIWKRWQTEGHSGLVHRNRGRASPRRTPPERKRRIMAIVAERYADFGPTLAAEKLAQDHGEPVHPELLRRWMVRSDRALYRRRRHAVHRSRRPRREHFGELLQLDGSPHAWFEDRGPDSCLMNLVDDATGWTMSLMREEETTEAAMRLLWDWIDAHGVPRALYVDRKNVYINPEDASGRRPPTAFGLACARLGIELIPAHSPQAKGRVERKHGVYQDRLIKELRLEGIQTVEATNGFLPKFNEAMNAKFAVAAQSRADFHRPLQAGAELREIFSIEERRTVNHDWTIRFNNQWFQIEKQKMMPRAKAQVVVRRRLDGTMSLLYQDRPLAYHAIAAPQSPAQAPATKTGAKARRPSAPWRPAPDHPWRGRIVGKQLARTERGLASVSLSHSCPTGGSKTSGAPKERRNPSQESAPPVGPPPRRSGRSPALPYPPDGPKSH